MTSDKKKSKPDAPTEQTNIGAQFVIAGYQPVSLKERLEAIGSQPMQPKRPARQKSCNYGLFDEDARNQMELFQ